MTEKETPATAAEDAEAWVKEALEKAEIARRKRQYQEGIELMLDALQCKVLVDMVYYRLGNLYFDSGDLARAEYAYMRAIETNPQHVNAHHNLSVVYKKTGRIHDSVRMRKRAARLEAGGLIGRKLAQATPPVFAKPVAGTPPGGMGEAVSVQDHVHPATAPPVDLGGSRGGSRSSDGVNDNGSAGGAGGVGRDGDDALELEAPYDESFHPLRDDPEGFRRFGTRVALAGLLVFGVVAVIFLGLIYIIGFWLF